MKHKPSISDDAILKATGRPWREWFGLLDCAGMHESSREEIIDFLREKHGVPAWWQQSIAGEYELYLGRRAASEPADGFHVSVSRTLDLPADAVYSAWADEPLRSRWLRRGDFEPSAFDAPRTIRGRWTRDDSRIDVAIGPVGDGKCRLVIDHRDLPDTGAAEEMRKFWETAIDRLEAKFS